MRGPLAAHANTPARRGAWHDLGSLLARYWFRQPGVLALSTTLLVAGVLADVAMPVAAGLLVDRIIEAVSSRAGAAAAQEALAWFIGASTVQLLLRWARSRTWNRMAATNMARLLDDTFHKVQRFSTDWHANTFAGATVRKITRGKWAYDAISDICWVHFLGLGLVVSGITAIMLYRFLAVGLMFLATVVVYVVASKAMALHYVRPANVQAAEADSAIGAALADAVTSNAVVKAFGAEDLEDARFAQVSGRWSDLACRSWNRGMNMFSVQQGLWVALQFGTIAVLIELALRGRASAGDVTFVLTASFQLGGQLQSVGQHIRHLQRAISEFYDVVAFHREPQDVADRPQAPALRARAGVIEFDRVTFGYRAASRPLFRDLSLRITAGERVGLVGHSGSGKSTFIKLLQRLYDVDAGEIRIDGHAIHHVCQCSLRRSIAMVPQDPVLFHRSLGENISYARPAASQAEIEAAAQRARAAEFIERLPHGYDTLVGERGVKLSGGERQRVAIARAFLANAPLLVFDEATSSLDTIAENHIKDAMDELMEGRTTLIIAHRLSTVRDVHRILVFEDGQIVEQGSHRALLRLPHGRYRAMHEAHSEGAPLEAMQQGSHSRCGS